MQEPLSEKLFRRNDRKAIYPETFLKKKARSFDPAHIEITQRNNPYCELLSNLDLKLSFPCVM